MKHGSHLYGTSHPESDQDFKRLFIPEKRDLLLTQALDECKIKANANITEATNILDVIPPKTTEPETKKNTKDDIDSSAYSLLYFLRLGFRSDTVFIDMIHADGDAILQGSAEWDFLRANRAKFYTKDLHLLLSYCQSMASRYGDRGNKIQLVEDIIELLKTKDPDARMKDCWEELPETEHSIKRVLENAKDQDWRAYEVCNRKIMANTKIGYTIEEILESILKTYGHRARAAKDNKGLDWKAISHAFRYGYQLKEIYETGDLVFPLKQAEFITKVKLGQFHFINEGLNVKLMDLVEEVVALAGKSTYPAKMNEDFWLDWYLNLF